MTKLINKEVIVFEKMLNMTFILGNNLSRRRIFRLVSQELVCKKKNLMKIFGVLIIEDVLYIFCLYLNLSVLFLIRQKMIWTNEHDLLLCREILLEEHFKYKVRPRERGKCWDKIANLLNAIEKPCSQ